MFACLFEIYLIFNYMIVHVPAYEYVQLSISVFIDQRHWSYLELEFQAVVNQRVWVLGPELRPSATAVHVLNY